MADKNSFPLSLLLKAVDGITAPLRRINSEIERVTGPARQAGNAIASIGQVGGFDRLRSSVGGVFSGLKSVGDEAETLFKRLAISVTAAGFAAYKFVQPAVDSGAALKFQADRLGISVDELASYTFAAREAHIESDEFNKRLDFFNKSLGQAKANRGQLRGLLLDVTGGARVLQQLVSAKTTGDALGIVVKRMNELPDKAKRAALAESAFGRDALAMENFAELGADRIAQLRTEFLGLADSQTKFADESVTIVQAEARLEAAWTGARNTLLRPLFPILQQQLGKLTAFLATHRGDIREWAQTGADAIGEFAATLPDRIRSFVSFAQTIRAVLQPIADLVGGWPTLFATIAAGILAGPLIGALAQLTASIVSLGLAIGFTPIGWLLGGLAAIAVAVIGLTALFRGLSDAQDQASKPREYSKPDKYRDIDAFMRGEERLHSSHGSDFPTLGGELGGPRPAASHSSVQLPGWAQMSTAFSKQRPTLLPALDASHGSPAPGGTVRLHSDDLGALADALRSSVTVDFKNMPRGVQIAPSRGMSMPNLSLGRSLAESH